MEFWPASLSSSSFEPSLPSSSSPSASSAVFISIQRLAYYFTGSSRLDVAATMVPAADMLQSSAGREVLASLADAGGLVDAAGGNGSLMFGS